MNRLSQFQSDTNLKEAATPQIEMGLYPKMSDYQQRSHNWSFH